MKDNIKIHKKIKEKILTFGFDEISMYVKK